LRERIAQRSFAELERGLSYCSWRLGRMASPAMDE
jgi:hypothetical protein